METNEVDMGLDLTASRQLQELIAVKALANDATDPTFILFTKRRDLAELEATSEFQKNKQQIEALNSPGHQLHTAVSKDHWPLYVRWKQLREGYSRAGESKPTYHSKHPRFTEENR